MITYLLKNYKVHLLLSTTVFVVILGLVVERNALNILSIFLGAMVGTFLLELDYFLYAYFLEPEAEFSKSIKGFLHDGDLLGALRYIAYHKNDVKEKTLNSALFQIVLGAALIFIVSSTAALWLKSMIISTFANSIYRMYEEYFDNRISEWFWAIKMDTGRVNLGIYTGTLIAALVYALTIIA